MGGSSEYAAHQDEVRQSGAFGYMEAQYEMHKLLDALQKVLRQDKVEEAIKLLETLVGEHRAKDEF
jgi:hypothetical protein